MILYKNGKELCIKHVVHSFWVISCRMLQTFCFGGFHALIEDVIAPSKSQSMPGFIRTQIIMIAMPIN